MLCGTHTKVHELAKRICPTHKVKRLTFDFPCNGLATVVVEAYVDAADLPLLEQVVEEQQPQPIIVPVAE